MVKRKSAASNAVRQAELSVRAARARAKNLLKNAQLDLRAYRKQLSTLKKQGLVAKRITPRSHQPTRYMLGKIKTFKGVALGHELPVPLSKISAHRAHEYVERGIAKRIGKFLTVPKTTVRQKADIYKGHIRLTSPLKMGEEEIILFGSRFEDMHDIINWLEENQERINELKGSKGQLGFQIGGHNSRSGVANTKELIKYLLQYDGTDPKAQGNIFNGSSKSIAKEFVIVRFRNNKGHPTLDPHYGVKRYSPNRRRGRKEEEKHAQHIREIERKRKARQRMAESKEEHAARLARQNQYDRNPERINDRREKRMAKRLLK